MLDSLTGRVRKLCGRLLRRSLCDITPVAADVESPDKGGTTAFSSRSLLSKATSGFSHERGENVEIGEVKDSHHCRIVTVQ